MPNISNPWAADVRGKEWLKNGRGKEWLRNSEIVSVFQDCVESNQTAFDLPFHAFKMYTIIFCVLSPSYNCNVLQNLALVVV